MLVPKDSAERRPGGLGGLFIRLNIRNREKLCHQKPEEVHPPTSGELLDAAFTELTQEFERNGNSPKFWELNERHSQRLIDYWLSKRDPRNLAPGETVAFAPGEMFPDEDQKVLLIERRTPMEEDEVSMSYDMWFGGVDPSLHPPEIKSKIKAGPDDPYFTTFYTVVFRNNKIASLERTVAKTSADYHSEIQDTRQIRCSF